MIARSVVIMLVADTAVPLPGGVAEAWCVVCACQACTSARLKSPHALPLYLHMFLINGLGPLGSPKPFRANESSPRIPWRRYVGSQGNPRDPQGILPWDHWAPLLGFPGAPDPEGIMNGVIEL